MSFDYFNFAVGHSDLCRFGPDDSPDYLNENRYLEIIPHERVVYASSITGDGRL